jgi:hypothetical protein
LGLVPGAAFMVFSQSSGYTGRGAATIAPWVWFGAGREAQGAEDLRNPSGLLLAFRPGARQAPGDPLFSPDGYRIAHYRGPVPAAPPGVRRIAPAGVLRLGRARC